MRRLKPVLSAIRSMAVPPLASKNVELLAGAGVTIRPLEPLGAAVDGLDLRKAPPAEVVEALQQEMAGRGLLVFKNQGQLTGDEQVRASELWGGRRIHSTHGVHPRAPNRHIFRLSNNDQFGIRGVGPQWHNDGAFLSEVFSHVGYHIIRVPEHGGDTVLAHLGAAFDRLPPATQERWQRLASVNSNGGVVHPMVHAHAISGRRSAFLHLGMTGAVLERVEGKWRALGRDEMTQLFNEYNDLLNAGLPERGGDYALSYPYEAGDCIFIDNLAVAHRAAPQAHEASQGLRILHRTTVAGMFPFGVEGLPAHMDIEGRNPFNGVWEGGGVGFRWDPTIHMQN